MSHTHVWGPLERSRLAGTVHRKCQVQGCRTIDALDEDDEMAKWLTLVPAYGRDYRTAQEVLDAWLAYKDFQIADVSSKWNGSYAGRGEFDEDMSTTFKIRYGTILGTGWELPNFVLIKNNKIVGVSDGKESETNE